VSYAVQLPETEKGMGFYKSLVYPAGITIFSEIFKLFDYFLTVKLISQFKVKSEVPSF